MNTHPIATLHYTEVLHSVIDKLPIQTNCWKHEFWSKEEINDFFKGDPSRPRSYIKRIPRIVTWPVSSTPYELASCDVCGSWDATKRVMDMLTK